MNKCDHAFGNTILHAVVYNDIAASARVLLIKGANPNAQNCHLETPLHWCCKMNAVKCATLLLNNGASINAIDNSGSSALHLVAAYCASIELATVLLDHGIDASLVDLDGKKAIDIAFENKNNGALQLQLYNYLHARNSTGVIADPIQEDLNGPHPSTNIKPVKVNSQKKKLVRVVDAAASRTTVVAKQSEPDKAVKKYDFIEELLKDEVITRTSFQQMADTVLLKNNSVSPVLADPLRVAKLEATKLVADIIGNRIRNACAVMTSTSPSKVTIGKSLPIPRKVPVIESDRDEKDTFVPSSPNRKNISRSKSAPILQPATASATFAIRRLERMKPVFMSTPVKDSTETMDGKLCTVIGVLPEISTDVSAPTLLKEISRQQDKIAQHFPTAKYIPFLPSNPAHLDVYIAVEQCADCGNHSWNLWHDERKYSSYGDLIITGLISQLISKEYPINLYAYKSKPEHARLGACDVTIAVFTENKSSSISDDDSYQTGWITHTLHSKIETSRWPSFKQVMKQAVKFLKVILVLYNNSQLKCSRVGERYMVDALRDSLGDWMSRTKTDITKCCIKYDKSMIHPVIISKSLANAQEAAAAKNSAKGKTDMLDVLLEGSDIENKIDDGEVHPESTIKSQDTFEPFKCLQYLNIPPSKDDLRTQETLMTWEANVLSTCFVYSLTE